MPKIQSSQVKDYLKIAAYLGVGYLAYKAIKNLAETFGIIKTQAQQQIDTTTQAAGGSTIEVQSSNPFLSFSPQYSNALVSAWQKKYPNKTWDNKKQLKFDLMLYKTYSDSLYNAKGIFKDDENSVLDIFRNLQTQYQLSFLSRTFSFYYKKDMLAYLKTFMDDNNLKDVLDIIKNYPQYYS